MINTIRVFPDRRLIPDTNHIGVIGENNAEIIKIQKPSELNGVPISNFDTVLRFCVGDTELDRTADRDGALSLDSELTAHKSLTLTVLFTMNGDIKWISYPLTLYLSEPIDDSGEHLPSASEARELCRTELSTALAAAMGEGIPDNVVFPRFDELTYSELVDFLDDLRDYISEAAEAFRGRPSDETISIGEAISIITSYQPPDGSEFLERLRISLGQQFGRDYSTATWEDIIGVLTDQNKYGGDISSDGSISEPVYAYEGGALWDMRVALDRLYQHVTLNFLTQSLRPPISCYGSISAITNENDTLRTTLISSLNRAFNLKMPFAYSWYEIFYEIQSIPERTDEARTMAATEAITPIYDVISENFGGAANE